MKEVLEQYGDVFENVELKKITSYKIGKIAKYVVMPANIECLVDLIEELKETKMPYLVFGSGSNIIIPDKDYEGVIIKLDNLNKLVIKGNKVVVGSGYYLPKLVKTTVNEGLKGLEWALGIPSSVGGAVVGNAGAYLSCIYDFIETVTYLNDKKQIVTLKKEDIKYSYRHSMFKDNKDYIVLECKLELSKGNYDASMAIIDDRMKRRLESQPLEYPSAGSVFRNPEGNYAGKLIEDLGLKGHIIGGAQISEKHANFIINIGNATGEDIIELINLIKEKVKEVYDIDLILEQEIIKW
ncbi:MAG: UDP-N-acetylmuramate dehydrogenase [Mollicutes bacterium]|nr:UDP-N-acetylmuramate dehydrogenase [Mollicutes bacterium]